MVLASDWTPLCEPKMSQIPVTDDLVPLLLNTH